MNSVQGFQIAWQLLLPETIVVATILFACLWNLFFPKLRLFTACISFIGCISSFFVLLLQDLVLQDLGKPISLFGGLFTIDHLTIGFGLIALVVAMVVVFMTSGYEQHLGRNAGEFYAIILTAVLAVMLLSGATDLIMLFIGIETLTICCVILAGFTKTDKRSSEASLKYLLSTAATTATLLYGLSFIYGLTGSTNFDVIRDQMTYLSLPPTSLLVMFLLVLVLSAVGFKLSAVPFHMWAPDVYEGAPTPVTAFLSIGSKAGGFVVALRLLMVVFKSSSQDWGLILVAMAILSMIIGNLLALSQTSFKRMLAYSSIAHIGYILMGFAAAAQVNNSMQVQKALSAMVFYLVIYGVMNLGAFAGAIIFSNETGSDSINDYAGLLKKRPFIALLLSLCLVNLAGLPIPPAGFLAKFFIFTAGFSAAWPIFGIPVGPILVFVGLITSIPAIYYYTRVVIKMIAQEPSAAVAALPNEESEDLKLIQIGPQIALVLCSVLILGFGTVLVDPVMSLSQRSISPLVPPNTAYGQEQMFAPPMPR
jgi:NAD(P)H-quinone oxidoreductase subunit 2